MLRAKLMLNVLPSACGRKLQSKPLLEFGRTQNCCRSLALRVLLVVSEVEVDFDSAEEAAQVQARRGCQHITHTLF